MEANPFEDRLWAANGDMLDKMRGLLNIATELAEFT